MRKEIALIFGSYDNPTHLSHRVWAEALSKEGMHLRLYSRRLHQDSNNGVEHVGVSERQETIQGLLKGVRRWPITSAKWFRSNRNMRFGKKVQLWAGFAPLLAAPPQVIHVINSYLYAELALVLKELNLPSVISFRGFDIAIRPWMDERWKRRLKEVFGSVKWLHFVSHYLQQEGIALGAPPEKTVVIYAGVDLDFFKPNEQLPEKDKNELSLISVGRLTWEKGYVYALRAVQNLIDSGMRVKYRIVGEGKDFPHVNFTLRKLGIGESVEFIGRQNREQVRKLLTASDIFVHPSVSEGLPRAILEASAMHLPVVASNIGGIPEAMKDGVTGTLVKEADPDELTRAIRDLALNKEMRTVMGNNGRKFIEEHFSLERETKEWIRFYSKVLDF